MGIFDIKDKEKSKAIFADKSFRCGGRNVSIKKCPLNISAFEELGWNEDLVIEKALNNIINSHIGPALRQNPDVMEVDFTLPPIKNKKTKVLDLSKLTEEQKETLKSMGLL